MLREPGDGYAQGVVGLNDEFSSAPTWNGHGACSRGVGTLKLSLPLSYPISSKVSSHSEASFKVVTKCPNNISTAMYHRYWAESLQMKAV